MIDFTWKNEKASEHGIIVQSLPPITKAPERTQKIEIEGRDGDIILSNGFSAYDKKVNIGLAKNYDVNWLINWLQGKGQVIFSNEDTVFYNAEIINQIDFKKLLSFKTATITFHVQPYKYLVQENQINFKGLSDNVSGNIMYLNDSSDNIIETFKIKGKCEQETRSGKNYIDNNKFVTKTNNGMTASINEDGSIKFSGTTTDLTNFWFNDLNEKLKAGTYKFVTNVDLVGKGRYTLIDNTSGSNVTIMNHTKTNSFTITEDITLNTILIQINADITLNNDFYIMLIDSSETETYEQYGAMPSPDYPSEIKTVKGIRNLFDKDNVSYGYYMSTSGNITEGVTNWYKTLIKVKPNTSYTFNGVITTNDSIGIAEFNANNEFIKQGLPYKNGSFTTSNDTKYLGVSIRATEIDYIQLEEGLLSHGLVPYGTWAKVKIISKNMFTLGIDTLKGDAQVIVNYNHNELILNGTTAYGGNVLKSRNVISNTGYRLIGKFRAGTYTLSSELVDGNFTIPSNASFALYLRDGNGKIIYSTSKIFTFNKTFTLTEETNLYFQMYCNSANQVFDNVKVRFMLEEGTIQTEHEVYKEKEVLIDLNKPNLFDKDKLEIGNSWNNNRVSTRATLVIEYEPNKYYSIKCSKMEDIENISIIETSNRLNPAYSISKTEPFELTRPLNPNAKYLCIQLQTTSDFDVSILNNLKLEIYESNNTDDYQELCSIGDTKDTLEVKNGEVLLTKRIGKVVLNGSESWRTDAGSVGTDYRHNLVFADNNLPNSITTSNGMMTHFALSSTNRTFGNFYINGNWLVVWDMNGNYTIDEFKTWLSENNVIVYYELAEPYQVKLNIIGNLTTYKNVSHITNNGDAEMELQYYRNCEFDINNQGYVNSKPIIEIEGTEEIYVYVNNNQSCILNLDNEKIILDSEEQEAYYDTTLKNNKMNGEFPCLSSGNNKVFLEGKIKNVIIHPKSRWL